MFREANKRLRGLEKLVGPIDTAVDIKKIDPTGNYGYLNWITARVNVESHDRYPYGEPIEIGTEVREVYNYPSGVWQGKVIGFSEDNAANIVERRDGKSDLMFHPTHKNISVTEAQELYEKYGKMVLEFHQLREFASKPLAEIEFPDEVREHINEAEEKKKNYDANPKKDIAAKGRERLSPKVTLYTNKDAFSMDWGGASDWCTSKWDQRYWETYASAAKEIYVVKIHPDDRGASQYLKDAKERYPLYGGQFRERLQEISHNGLVPFAVAVTVREKKNKDHDPSDPSSEEYTRFRTVSEIVDLRNHNPPAEGIRETIVGELEALNKSIQGAGSGDLYEHLLELGYPLDEATEITANYAAIGVEDADWHSLGFEPPEAKEWIDAGFDEAEVADAWKRHGFNDPVEARSWAEMIDGVYGQVIDEAELAAEWKEGIGGVNAAEFYLHREVEIDTAKKIDGWVGLGPENEWQIPQRQLVEAVLELDEDSQNGFSIGADHLDKIRPISELYDGSEHKKELRSAAEIKELIYGADEIAEHEGIDFSDALILVRLSDEEYNAWSSSPGIDLSYASSWIDFGFTLDEYKKWKPHFDADESALDVYKWKLGTEHMSFEAAMKWKDAEFNLPQMSGWTKPDSMFSVQEANEWITAGVPKSKGYTAAGYRQAGITPGELPAIIELSKVTYNRYGVIELKKLLNAGATTSDSKELEHLHEGLPFDEILERVQSGAIKEHFVPEEKEPTWKCLGCGYENDQEEIPSTCPDCGKWNTFRKFSARIDDDRTAMLKDANKKLRGLESLAGSMPVEAVDKIEEIDPGNKRGYLNWIVEQVNVEARPLATRDDVGKEAIAFHRNMNPIQGIITDYESGDEFIIGGRAVRSPRLRDIDPDKARSLFSELVESVTAFHAQREYVPGIQSMQNADDLHTAIETATSRPDKDRATEGRHSLSGEVTYYANKDAFHLDWGGSSDWCTSKWDQDYWESYAKTKDIYVVKLPADAPEVSAHMEASEKTPEQLQVRGIAPFAIAVVKKTQKVVEIRDLRDGLVSTLHEALYEQIVGELTHVRPDVSGITSSDLYQAFLEHGFSEEQAETETAHWSEEGIYDAEWYQYGFEPKVAAEWIANDFDAIDATEWRDHGFEVPHDAREWSNATALYAEIDGVRAEIAKEWHDYRFSADEAVFFVQEDIGPDEARKFRDISSDKDVLRVLLELWRADLFDDVYVFDNAGPRENTPEAWRAHVLRAAELADLYDIELAEATTYAVETDAELAAWGDDLDSAFFWITNNFTAQTAAPWIAKGYLSDDAWLWTKRGFTVDQAEEYKAVNVDVEEATNWREFSIPEMRQWQEAVGSKGKHLAARGLRNIGARPDEATAFIAMQRQTMWRITPEKVLALVRAGLSPDGLTQEEQEYGTYDQLMQKTAGRVDDVRARYPNAEEDIEKLSAQDPSGKNTYLMWMMQRLLDDGVEAPRIITAVSAFHKHKQRLPKDARDLNAYPSVSALEEAIADLGQSRREQKDEGARVVAEFADGKIVQILTWQASCQYGANTRWCISGDEAEQHFTNYADEYDTYFWVPSSNVEDEEKGTTDYKWAVQTESGTKNITTVWDDEDKRRPAIDLPEEFFGAGFVERVATIYIVRDTSDRDPNVGRAYTDLEKAEEALFDMQSESWEGPVFLNIIRAKMPMETYDELSLSDGDWLRAYYWRASRNGLIEETTVYDSWADVSATVVTVSGDEPVAAFEGASEAEDYVDIAKEQGHDTSEWSITEQTITNADYDWLTSLGLNEVMPRTANKKLRSLENVIGELPGAQAIKDIDPDGKRGYLNWIIQQVNTEARPKALSYNVGAEVIDVGAGVQGTMIDVGVIETNSGELVQSQNIRLRDVDVTYARELFEELAEDVVEFHGFSNMPALSGDPYDMRNELVKARARPSVEHAAEGRHPLPGGVVKYTNKDAFHLDWSGKSDWCTSKWDNSAWGDYAAAGKEIYVVHTAGQPHALATLNDEIVEVVDLRNTEINEHSTEWEDLRDQLRTALGTPDAFQQFREFLEETEENWDIEYTLNDWDREGPAYPVSWIMAGFAIEDPEDAKGWEVAGFGPKEAHTWNLYTYPERAKAWKDAGYVASDAWKHAKGGRSLPALPTSIG